VKRREGAEVQRLRTRASEAIEAWFFLSVRGVDVDGVGDEHQVAVEVAHFGGEPKQRQARSARILRQFNGWPFGIE
jgi:hypothetical protein